MRKFDGKNLPMRLCISVALLTVCCATSACSKAEGPRLFANHACSDDEIGWIHDPAKDGSNAVHAYVKWLVSVERGGAYRWGIELVTADQLAAELSKAQQQVPQMATLFVSLDEEVDCEAVGELGKIVKTNYSCANNNCVLAPPEPLLRHPPSVDQTDR